MKEYLSKNEILNIINSLGDGRYNFYDDNDLERLINILSKIEKNQVDKILSGAFFYNEYIKKNVNELTLNKIISIILSVDQESLKNYEVAIDNLKKTGMNEKVVHEVVKQIYASVYDKIVQENRNIFELSSDFVVQADKVSSTFSDINKNLKNDLINTIYLNCLSRMKNFWQKVEAQNFTNVVDTLMNDLDDNRFSEDEIIELSKKCATIFCESSRDKIMGVELVLSEYKDFCLNLLENSIEMSPDNIQKLKDFKVGQVFRTSASISKANTRTLFHTSEFLKGKSIAEIFRHKIGTDDKNARLYEEYRDVKLDLSLNDMVWALTKNPSLFTNSITSTLEFVDKIKLAINQSYGEKAVNFDFNKLITKDNFFKGIPKNIEQENISKNVELLSCFMNINDLFEYLSTDMSIFNIDSEKLHEIILEVFIKNKKSDDITKKLNNILKNKVNEELKILLLKKDKSKHIEKTTVQENQSKNLAPNVHFSYKEISDFTFNFDLKKLKLFLGKHYDEFISGLKKSGVNSSKIQDIIIQDEQASAKLKSGGNGVDLNSLLQSVHNGYEDRLNRIELLWQLQRNISSAINLINLFVKNGELDTQRMYVISSNYFKLAGEKHLYFNHLDKIEEHYKHTADYLVEKIDKNFEILTQKFAEVSRDNSEQLDLFADKLIRQRKIIEKQINSYTFENIDDNIHLDLEKRKQELTLALTSLQMDYEQKHKLYKENKQSIINVRKQIKTEQETPTDVYDLSKIDGKIDLFHYAFVGNKERELHNQLDKLLNIECDLEMDTKNLIKQITSLKKEISQIDKNLKGSEIYNALMMRINELEARLNYALKVKQAIDKNESEK